MLAELCNGIPIIPLMAIIGGNAFGFHWEPPSRRMVIFAITILVLVTIIDILRIIYGRGLGGYLPADDGSYIMLFIAGGYVSHRVCRFLESWKRTYGRIAR